MLLKHLASEEIIRPPDTILYSRQRSQQPRANRINPIHSSSAFYMPRGRSIRAEPEVEENLTPIDDDIENHRDWHHYHGYKERRDIYEQLQAITSL